MHNYYAGEEDELSNGGFVLLMAFVAFFILLTIAAVLAIPFAVIYLSGPLEYLTLIIAACCLGLGLGLTLDTKPKYLKEAACFLAMLVFMGMFAFAIISGPLDLITGS